MRSGFFSLLHLLLVSFVVSVNILKLTPSAYTRETSMAYSLTPLLIKKVKLSLCLTN
jgi:hypothetical protein